MARHEQVLVAAPPGCKQPGHPAWRLRDDFSATFVILQKSI
jgi:hypothetical protein